MSAIPDDFTSNGIPVVDLDTKLRYLRACILDGSFEDAQGHLHCLQQSLYWRQLLQNGKVSSLSPEQHKLLRYTEVLDTMGGGQP